MKAKPFLVPIDSDLSQFAPCMVSPVMVEMPIEDHPSFSNPDVRFRHKRIRDGFKRLKAGGIETFMVPRYQIQPD